MNRYADLEDLISDLDNESILENTSVLDDEDLELLLPPSRHSAPGNPSKKRGRPKKVRL